VFSEEDSDLESCEVEVFASPGVLDVASPTAASAAAASVVAASAAAASAAAASVAAASAAAALRAAVRVFVAVFEAALDGFVAGAAAFVSDAACSSDAAFTSGAVSGTSFISSDINLRNSFPASPGFGSTPAMLSSAKTCAPVEQRLGRVLRLQKQKGNIRFVKTKNGYLLSWERKCA
jgi:hypothetical protein